MTSLKPTVDHVLALDSSDVYQIVSEYQIQRSNHLWLSGTAALASVYGLEMDNPELLAVESAANRVSSEIGLKVAIRWAWLAVVGKESLTATQFQVLTGPWASYVA